MAKKTVKKVDIIKTPEGICLNEKSFGKVHELEKKTSIFGVEEYIYRGKLHQGEITFVGGEGLQDVYPTKEGENHGYTLEGEAQKLFQAENALVRHSESEDRDFVYVNPDDAHAHMAKTGNLGDIAVTVLQVMGLEKPADMTAKSLIEK